MMQKKVIITSAVTGAGATTEKSKHVFVTPKEIAEAAINSAKAGAAIAHIHVRDPQTGGVSHDANLYKEVVERVRSEEHTSELQSRGHLVCRLLLEKKKKTKSKLHT